MALIRPAPHRPFRWLSALLLVPGLAGCSATGRLSGASPDPLPLPPGITVAFNHRAEARYRSPISGQWRSGDDLEALLLEAIRSARRELLVAVQELSLPAVAEALVERQRAGVTVRVVLENTYSQPWSEQHDAELNPHLRQRKQQLMALADRNHDGVLSGDERQRGDAVAILKRAGVPLLDDTADGSAGSGLMHSKFLVVDRRLVVSGSANFTPSCIHGDPDDDRTRGNVNHLLRIESAPLAAAFGVEFRRMWGDGPGGRPDSRFGLAKQAGGVQELWVGPSRLRLLFAPHRRSDPNQGLTLLASVLAEARRRADLALFVFSAQELTTSLVQLQQRGVALRVLADPGFASRPFSEVLDLLGAALPDRDCGLEAGNRPLARPLEGVGMPRLARGDKLHHKLAVIDGRTVVSGSFNWSPSAAHQNDETLLVIDSSLLAAHFSREMDRLWRDAELGLNPRLQRRLERGRQLCGSGRMRR
ncbi:phospholipase [Synechococcus sp. GreenBA-s]|nr:phospholipase [Synechococcus sp. GreenBA-s]